MGCPRRTGAAALLAAALLGAPAAHADLVLGIQPILSPQHTMTAFRPLAEFISQVTGQRCVIRTQPNFFSYWLSLRQPDAYDLVLDAAHFTDYRIEKQGYHVLVKLPGTVTYSLIVRQDRLVFDPADLTGRVIATLGPPSIGAARLQAMFPNPDRQPVIVQVDSSEQGMAMLLQGKVAAAILPTPIVSEQMARGTPIAVVVTTEPIPAIALSASPRVSAPMRAAIRAALLNASKTPAGQKMLKALGFAAFVPATAAMYAGQEKILSQYWGY